MKQLLFLLLFPCLAMAQYQGNGNQKITLGEQTTADGLVWRGIRADTTSKIVPFSDTSAYIILDTVEKTLWLYKAGQIPKWQQVGGSTLDTATMLLPYWRSGRFSGVLPVANGGTGASTAFTQGSVVFAGASGTYTQDNNGLFYNSTDKRLAIGQSQNLSGAALSIRGGLHIIDADTTDGVDNLMYIYPKEQTTSGPNSSEFAIFMAGPGSTSTSDGPVISLRGNNYVRNANQKGAILIYSGINTTANGNNGKIIIESEHGIDFKGAAKFNTLEGSSLRPVNAAADGTLSASSSITIKENVSNLNYGLDKIMQLQPKSFNYIDKNKYGEGLDIGFIAEDVYTIVPEATGTMNDGFIYFDAVRLIPILTKAIQEQQALIKALEQRILTLENK